MKHQTTPCPSCRAKGRDKSGDNLVHFEDGGTKCFSCGYYTLADGTAMDGETEDPRFLVGKICAIPERGLTKDACEKYDYRLAKINGEIVHVACWREDGLLTRQKIRYPDKRFQIIGGGKDMPFFGQHLVPAGGKRLVITEGELDAISVYQAQGHRYPAVSVPNGADSAADCFKQNLEWLNSFDTVVLAFDNDEPGQRAAQVCAALLRPGKAKIAILPKKDANAHLMAGDSTGLIQALWDAKDFKPDGIVHISEVVRSNDIQLVGDYPWDGLTQALYGRGEAELILHTSGTGMGKSTVLREMISHDLKGGGPVGIMMLEESVFDTKAEIMSTYLHKPIKKILRSRMINKARKEAGLTPLNFNVVDDMTDEEYQSAVEYVNSLPLYLYDHFGSVESEKLINGLDYMATGLGCNRIYLDHISIVISGRETNDERKDIDVLMTHLRSFVERTKCNLNAVCHLRKTSNKPYEEGGQISLQDLRGSGSLAQLSDIVIGYERNQQDPDPLVASTVMVRVLKDRFGGNTGLKVALRYDPDTTQLTEVPFVSNSVLFNQESESHNEASDPIHSNYSII